MTIAAMLLASSDASTGIVLQPANPTSFGAGPRTAAFRISSDGNVYHGDNGVFTLQYQWKQNGNAASGYEARVDVSVGPISGTTGSWLGLGSDRDWSVTDAVADGENDIVYATVQIRNASTLVVLASEELNLNAYRWS